MREYKTLEEFIKGKDISKNQWSKLFKAIGIEVEDYEEGEIPHVEQLLILVDWDWEEFWEIWKWGARDTLSKVFDGWVDIDKLQKEEQEKFGVFTHKYKLLNKYNHEDTYYLLDISP